MYFKLQMNVLDTSWAFSLKSKKGTRMQMLQREVTFF